MGAKNLLVVSQNAEASDDVGDMKALAKADGCNLVIRSSDVADEKSFGDLLSEYKGVLPPIRGVIDATQTLEVCYRCCFWGNRWKGSSANLTDIGQ